MLSYCDIYNNYIIEIQYEHPFYCLSIYNADYQLVYESRYRFQSIAEQSAYEEVSRLAGVA